MQSPFSKSFFDLPDPVDPGEYWCVTIKVPKSAKHMQAFMGVIYDLTQWINWQRDRAHTGTLAARVWKPIWQAIKFQECSGESTQLYEEVNDMVAFRQDCDCNLFVKCCDGTEKQVLLKGQASPPGQPGAGSPQPAPGGGTQQYCNKLRANSKLLIPTLVNTGDVITIDSASGAGNDNTTLLWYCPDGQHFALNLCGGGQSTYGPDPLPTAFHMAIILNIAGVFYDIMAGPITVPGGVSNGQAYLQVNDGNIFDNSGDYDVCLTVTNNQTVTSTWRHLFLGGAGKGSLVIPATGYTDGAYDSALDRVDVTLDGGTGFYYADANLAFTSTTITRIVATFVVTDDGVPSSSRTGITFDAAITDGRFISPKTPGTYVVDTGPIMEAHTLIYFILSNRTGNDGYITSIMVEGNGTDPF